MKTLTILSICICLAGCQTKKQKGAETKPLAGIVKSAQTSNTSATNRTKKIKTNTESLQSKLTDSQLDSKELSELIQDLKKTL